MVIVSVDKVVWLAAVMLRPDEVGPSPPTSEAILISAISGLVGVIGGAALAELSGRRRQDEEEQDDYYL